MNVGQDNIKKGFKHCECGCLELIKAWNANLRRPRRYKRTHIKGENNHQWRGGRMFNGTYWMLLKPEHHQSNRRGYVKEHRLVYEDIHTCCLLSWADVHHKDGNRSNNVWYNLNALLHSQHTVLHNLVKPRKRGRWIKV